MPIGPRDCPHRYERVFAQFIEREAVADVFRDIFEEGRNLPSEHPAELLLVLASGKADALSARFLTPHDDFDEIIGLAAKVKR